ncbi:hypothetical protein LXA43DRAFT_1093983 [Ganoderma leucocontextum]|nr:hypothetical protein LXA43DRAFT_1093983 [Ganoderma leucocontextum]
MSVFRERDPDLIMEEATTTQRAPGSASSSTFPLANANTQSQPLRSVFATPSAPPSTGFDWKTGRPFPPISSTTPSGRQEPLSAEETPHAGISCDFCGKVGIRGIRYKCVQLRQMQCVHDLPQRMGGPRCDQFFPIRTKDDLFHLAQVVARLPQQSLGPPATVHAGITCDGCTKPIEGVRHKCLVCDDYDFCITCISDPSKRQGHNPIHAFFAIITPQDKALYDKARTQAQPQGVRHESVVCDTCRTSPLVGVRHHCLDCRDYDMCTECISNPQLRLKHDLTHGFFPIPTPADLTSYNGASEVRRASPGLQTSQKPVQLTAKISELVSGVDNPIPGA